MTQNRIQDSKQLRWGLNDLLGEILEEIIRPNSGILEEIMVNNGYYMVNVWLFYGW